jgi:hypothetical protein
VLVSCGDWSSDVCSSDLGSRLDVRDSAVSSVAAAALDPSEHEPQRQLLGQCANGELLPHAKDGTGDAL